MFCYQVPHNTTFRRHDTYFQEKRHGTHTGNILFYAFVSKTESVGSMALFQEMCVVTTKRSVVFYKLNNKAQASLLSKQLAKTSNMLLKNAWCVSTHLLALNMGLLHCQIYNENHLPIILAEEHK